MYRTLLLLCGLVAILASVGCQATKPVTNPASSDSLKSLNVFSNKKAEKDKEKPLPDRMVVIWNNASISDVGKPSMRGFGGRIYFYDKEGEPVKVDGDLVVYAYDEDENKGSKAADRKYVFKRKDLQGHYSETELGPSYSVWLPWDRIGGMRKTIALLPLFKDARGHIVRGGQSLNVLSGKSPKPQPVARDEETQTRFLGASPALAENIKPNWQPPSRKGSPGADKQPKSRSNGARATAENHTVHQETDRALGHPAMPGQKAQEGVPSQAMGQAKANGAPRNHAVQQSLPSSLRTTTINVPRNLGSQMRQNQRAIVKDAAGGKPTAPPNEENRRTSAAANAEQETSPLLRQLHAQNQLDGNTTVTYGNSNARQPPQSLPVNKSQGAEPRVGSRSGELQRSEDEASSKRKVFGQPGSFR